MKNIKIEKKNSIKESVEVENSYILFNEETDSISILDENAVVIWNLLDSESDFSVICDKIYAMYDESKPPFDEFLKDIDDCLSTMYKGGLLNIFFDGILYISEEEPLVSGATQLLKHDEIK